MTKDCKSSTAEQETPSSLGLDRLHMQNLTTLLFIWACGVGLHIGGLYRDFTSLVLSSRLSHTDILEV